MKKIIRFLLISVFCTIPLLGDNQQEPNTPQNMAFLSKKALLFADSVTYDNAQQFVHAQGRVEIIYDKQLLVCDHITYDRNADLITAWGNVWIRDALGHITFAEHVELSSDFNRADVDNIRTLMTNDARLAANKLHRVSLHDNRLDKVVYSPCNICKKDPESQPLWQLRASHVIWDEDADDMEYTDAVLEFGGIPVVYTPYMRHPGPRVKRRSGLLAPFVGGATGLGFVAGAPYFWVIDDQKDLKITPVITGTDPLIMMTYRQRFRQGEFSLDWSLTQSRFKKDSRQVDPKKKHLRGHIKSFLSYDFNENWRGGFNVIRVLDDTYFRKYHFLNQKQDSFLGSRVFAERFSVRDYTLIEALGFQGMRQEDRSSLIPYVAPAVESHFIRPLSFMPGNWFTDLHFLNLGRQEGGMMQRLSGTTGWEMTHYTPYGLVIEPRLQVRQDLYQIEKYTFSAIPGEKFTGQQGRFIPQAMTNLRYPFVRFIDKARVIIEPIFGAVLTPKAQTKRKIPNEDNNLFELSDVNLFSPSRFAGLDRLDPGSRLNWGLHTLLFSTAFSNSEIFVGQSYAFHTPGKGFENTGLEHKLSDYIARVRLNYTSWFTLEGRGLFDRSSLNAKREEVTLAFGQPLLKLNVTYSRLPRITTPTLASEQVSYGFSSQLTETWSVVGNVSREAGRKGGKLSQGAGVKYEDECFIFETTATKNFYIDRDIKPGTTVMFRFAFKTLGEFSFSSNDLGLTKQNTPVTNDENNPNQDKTTP